MSDMIGCPGCDIYHDDEACWRCRAADAEAALISERQRRETAERRADEAGAATAEMRAALRLHDITATGHTTERGHRTLDEIRRAALASDAGRQWLADARALVESAHAVLIHATIETNKESLRLATIAIETDLARRLSKERGS